jgi:hypothetical protein
MQEDVHPSWVDARVTGFDELVVVAEVPEVVIDQT